MALSVVSYVKIKLVSMDVSQVCFVSNETGGCYSMLLVMLHIMDGSSGFGVPMSACW